MPKAGAVPKAGVVPLDAELDARLDTGGPVAPTDLVSVEVTHPEVPGVDVGASKAISVFMEVSKLFLSALLEKGLNWELEDTWSFKESKENVTFRTGFT